MDDYTIQPITEGSRNHLLQFLQKDSEANVFFIDAVCKINFSRSNINTKIWGVFYENVLVAAACSFKSKMNGPADLTIPYGDITALKLLGRFEQDRGGTKVIEGYSDSVSAFLEGMGDLNFEIHRDSYVYTTDGLDTVDVKSDLNIIYQVATLNHKEEIVSILKLALIEEYDRKVKQTDKHVESILKSIAKSEYIIGLDEDEVVVVIKAKRIESGFALSNLYVKNAFRKHNLAKQMIYAVAGKHSYMIKNFGKCFLKADEKNYIATNLYEKIGFVKASPCKTVVTDA